MRLRVIVAVVVLLGGLLLTAQECPKENIPPVARFTVDQASGTSPLTVNFDATASYDPDGTIVSYSWDFGDGTTGTGITITHTFTSSTDRTYTVTLTVTDNGGKTGSLSSSIVVHGSPPGPTPGTLLFTDTFEGGPDPTWSPTSDGWDTCYGTYWFQPFWGSDQWSYSFVAKGKNWENYTVEADIRLPDCSESAIGLILRAQENLNSMVVVYGNNQAIFWGVLKGGKYIIKSKPISPGFFIGWQHVKVEVSGSIYKLFVKGLLRSTFNDSHFLKGMPGVAAYNPYVFEGFCPDCGPSFDNFVVYSN